MKFLVLLCLAAVLAPLQLMAQTPDQHREKLANLIERGMWREAVDHYAEALLPVSDGKSGEDLEKAVRALGRLDAWGEFDPLVERAVAAHPENADLLVEAAGAYENAPHFGRLIAGDFERMQGQHRYGRRGGPGAEPEPEAGNFVATDFRDRVRALQLIRQAEAAAADDARRLDIWQETSRMLHRVDAWKLQTLTPLGELPPWGEPGAEGGTEGAPWLEDGPVLYPVPASWDAAKNDGERWRFALDRQVALARQLERPQAATDAVMAHAVFSKSQFGVETLASFGWWREQDPAEAKGILEVDTLADDECLAKTSAGVRRFKLPDEHHFIALFRSILDEHAPAGDALVQVFLNRRQFGKARETLERVIERHGPGNRNHRTELLKQITGNWGRFELADTVPAGTRPEIPLVFRNANEINLTAAPVDMDAVLRETRAYLEGNPRELDWQRLNPSQIARRLLEQGKYIGKPAAEWEQRLVPLDDHADARAMVEVPLDAAGAWWITGKMEDGNTFYTLVWIVDSVLVARDVAGKKQWWVADAASGAPVEKAEIDFFGYRVVHTDRPKPLARNFNVRTKSFERTTDDDGKTLLGPGDFDPHYQWLAVARKQGRAPAFFGFQSLHIQTPHLENGNRDISYGISDRPLYKPGDTARLKFYLRNVGYFDPNGDAFANKSGTLVLVNGRGEEVLKLENVRTDALGAAEAEVVLPKDGGLGVWMANYQMPGAISASVSFSVEEYRKPEFEVTVEAPDEPVKLGDKFTATVTATYFHGSPVRNAEVEIIVKRGSMTERWFPAWRWDWLYGRGAWWNGSAARWHPTWEIWGCLPPRPPWWQGDRWTPDELVMKRVVAIGPDGTARIEVDTATAKAIHGDMDARYSIEARVTDASRREQIGTGSVIAARRPFEVVVWTNRGYTRAGEPVEANISAATLAGKPVVGAKGNLVIFKLTGGDDGRIVEEEIARFPIETDAEGEAKHQFPAPPTGQYRLAAQLAAGDGEIVEGAIILNVHAPGQEDPEDWNFGPLELVADKPTHAPGETLKLRVNSDQTDAHVWLFLHIGGSSGREARRIQLDGKSMEIEVPLDRRDMPNMFIEGVTVHSAEVHTAVQQVLLPPVSKVVEVTLEPAKDRVKPRENSALRIVLRDADGKPFVGEAVLTIYDKALEAITGGSNVGSIQETFWSWKNNYYPTGNSNSIPDSPGNLVRPKTEAMQQLGIFAEQGMALGGAMRFSRAAGRDMNSMDAMPMAMAAESSMVAEKQMGAPEAAAPIMVRKDFADLLKWSGSVRTGEDGSVEVPLEFPDNLTTWKARVWTLGKGTEVGEGSAEIITTKDLLVRLQAPRFLVERDEAVLSAVVQNDHDAAKTVTVSLELDGDELAPLDTAPRTVEIAARSEARVDWRVKAVREGEAKFRMRADAGDDGDAVERTLPVLVHGMLRQDAWSRVVQPDEESATIIVEVPEQRRAVETKLTIRFSPSVAGAVVDAIPYLASYPHGCTEQTLNRFVPAVIARRMLTELDVNLAEIKAKRANLNPQELGDSATRAAQWKQWQTNPVFDDLEMETMVAAGIEKLMSMQISDGGWGWFSGFGESSYPHTTAVVVHGLLAAEQAGTDLPDEMLQAGIRWLMAYERKQVDALQLHVEREALRAAGREIKDDDRYEKSQADALDAFVRMVLGEARRDSVPMLGFLYRDRLELPVYAKCLLGLELHRSNDDLRRDEVMRMISQFLKRDEENQTAYLDLQNANYWWIWYGSEIEAHAWYLKLLAAVKPHEPETRGLVKYLVNNRKHASYWESTRDTAYAIEAIADYFRASGENAPEMTVQILMDGKPLREISISRENLFTFDGTITLEGDAVGAGKHDIVLRRTGKGTLYANAYLQVFTLEDNFRPAGLEVKVTRRISKLIPLEKEAEVPDASGLVVKQQVERFKREPLEDGAVIEPGDRVEVELIMDSKNDYEYLIFSDAKAAGLESLQALSGYVGGGAGFTAYMEPRDLTVDFFIRALPRGTHTLRYQLRAETPGVFKAMPATVEGMYAPELRGNSADQLIRVVE